MEWSGPRPVWDENKPMQTKQKQKTRKISGKQHWKVTFSIFVGTRCLILHSQAKNDTLMESCWGQCAGKQQIKCHSGYISKCSVISVDIFLHIGLIIGAILMCCFYTLLSNCAWPFRIIYLLCICQIDVINSLSALIYRIQINIFIMHLSKWYYNWP